VDFNCYNQFIFGRQAMQTLTDSGYIPEELFSQKGSMAEDAKFDKTLMADLSRQARQPMTVVLELQQGESCNNVVGMASLDK